MTIDNINKRCEKTFVVLTQGHDLRWYKCECLQGLNEQNSDKQLWLKIFGNEWIKYSIRLMIFIITRVPVLDLRILMENLFNKNWLWKLIFSDYMWQNFADLKDHTRQIIHEENWPKATSDSEYLQSAAASLSGFHMRPPNKTQHAA